jgi:hypothetical protein
MMNRLSLASRKSAVLGERLQLTKQATADDVIRLFESVRQGPGAAYESDRLLAYLTEPPAATGRRVRDTFAGRRRLVAFLEALAALAAASRSLAGYVLFGSIWLCLVADVVVVNVRGYRYAKRLLERIRSAVEQGAETEEAR